ncbi:hypothetical protein ABH924_004413 [Arthrobacter sp. GAS37]
MPDNRFFVDELQQRTVASIPVNFIFGKLIGRGNRPIIPIKLTAGFVTNGIFTG